MSSFGRWGAGEGGELLRPPVVPEAGSEGPRSVEQAALVHPFPVPTRLHVPQGDLTSGNGALTPGRPPPPFPPLAVRVTLMIDPGGGLRVLAGVGGVSCLGMWG